MDARNNMSKFQERRNFDFANVAWTKFAPLSSYYYMSSSFTSTNVQPKPRNTIKEPLFNCWSGNVRRERGNRGVNKETNNWKEDMVSKKRNNKENKEICGGGWRFGQRRIRRNGQNQMEGFRGSWSDCHSRRNKWWIYKNSKQTMWVSVIFKFFLTKLKCKTKLNTKIKGCMWAVWWGCRRPWSWP